MKVSIFKTVKDTSNPFNKEVLYCLNRIKEGNSKTLVEWLRNQTPEIYSRDKSKLPIVCFNGSFSYRSDSGLIAKSGLIVLDFDKFESTEAAQLWKEHLTNDEYIFSCWMSPSNKGVKALVRITTDKNHAGYFLALGERYKDDLPEGTWDESGKDLARACFESYDPDLYINHDALIFDEVEEPNIENLGCETPLLPLQSDNTIIRNLNTWWTKKYGLTKGSKNNNLFILASSYNDFGITHSVAESELMALVQDSSKEKEVLLVAKSAYRNTANHGSKHFEDEKEVSKIKKMLLTGTPHADIVEASSSLGADAVKACIRGLKEKSSVRNFWNVDEKGVISLSAHKFKFWLEQNNFYKYFPTDSNTYTFIKVDQNLVEETNEKRVKDFTLETLLQRKDVGFEPFDYMAGRTKYFTPEFLSMIESSDINLKEDTADTAFLYYKNSVVEVKKDSVKEIDYIDIDGYVWRNQITDRDFTRADHHKSEFRRFVWLICGEDPLKYNSFKSVIGYLLHTYKTSANNKAIIFNDETISDNPNGGSGKGLFCSAISKIKKVATIDGKTFDHNKSFPYQTVSTDTQLLVFDDVKKNFSFESLFSLITEGITLEYKGQDAIRIPVSKSPKILISTNYTVGGVGGSFERRKFEVEMSSYFNYQHTPVDEFGHMLFDDWNADEWNRFDNFMIECLQLYLRNGLVSHEFKNLDVRKFIKNTSHEFYEWTQEGNLKINERTNKGAAHDLFILDYPDLNTFKFKLSIRMFMKWVKVYAEFYEYGYEEGNTNGERWFEVIDDKTKQGDAPF